MSNTITVTKLVNEISFKIENKSWRQANDKIKKMAALWHKSSNAMTSAMVAGRRAAGTEQKALGRTQLALIRQQKTKKETLRADNIKHALAIKQSLQFRQQLQKTNAAFLQGTISTKERAASIGALVKQYRQLNSAAGTYNKQSRGIGAIRGVSRGISSVTRAGVVGGAAAVGVGGYAATSGFNKVKETGVQFESLVIQLQNTFEDRAQEISTIMRNMADANGAPILELGNNLIEFVSLMRPLGVSVDDAIKKFQQTQDAMQSYAIGGERALGFQQQLTQALDQGTLDSFKEAFAWAPQLRADLLQYVQKEMNVSQKEFLSGLTNGKFNLKDTWFKFLNANSNKYAGMSAKFKSSSMAQDARAGNQLSIAIFRIFDSTGFKTAMQYASDIIISWATLLESNADKIGQVFSNLYQIVGELSKEGFQSLSTWLSELKADDIKSFFNELKTAVKDLAYVISSVANFIRSFVPKEYIPVAPEVAKENAAAKEAQTSNWRNSATTYGPKITIPQSTFVPPTVENSLVRRPAINTTSAPANFSGSLNLKINAEVNEQGFSNFVDYKIDNNNMQQINLISD